MTGTRTLILLRHAKSDYPDGVADHERPLAKRGIREAALADEKVAAAIEGKNVVKFVYIKGRLANIVVK